jgi:hypothetical protein
MNRFSFRPQVEPLDGRCLPSASPAISIGDVALVPAAAAHVAASEQHAVPIQLSAHITSDGSGVLNLTGVGSQLGCWTGQGSIDTVVIDAAADRVAVSATVTIVAANGDRLFVSVSVSLNLRTGLGEETLTFSGGTGRFAGASGSASGVCEDVTWDPTSPLTFACNSQGSGILVFAHER